MGKGKKKGGGKTTATPIDLSIDTLTLDEPSTSQPVEEEEGVGLTGGGRKKKKEKQKPAQVKVEPVAEEKQPEPSAAAAPEPHKPQPSKAEPPKPEPPKAEPPKAEPPKPEPPKPEPPKEEEFEGLTGTKKSKPRKKKPAQPQQQQPPQPQQLPQQPPQQPPRQPQQLPQQPPRQPQQLPQQPSWQPQQHPQQPLPSASGPAPSSAQQTPWAAQAGSTKASSWQTNPLASAATPSPWAKACAPSVPVSAQPAQRPQPAQPTYTQPPGPSGEQASTQLVPASNHHRIPQYGSCVFKIPHKIIGNSVRAPVVKVITNYLPMVVKATKVYRYDILVRPDKPKKMHPMAFKKVKEAHFPREMIAFDQVKNCYTLNPLKLRNGESEEYTADVNDSNGKSMQFKVQIKRTGLIDLGNLQRYCDSKETSLNPPMEEIQCIDVILRQGALESYVKTGRQYFKRPAKPIDLTGGLEMWTGLFQSALFTSRPFINIDVAHKGFPIQQPLIEAWKSFGLAVNKPLEAQFCRGTEIFKEFVRNLKVVCKIVGSQPSGGETREYQCNGVADTPSKLFFLTEDGKRLSVYEYYENIKRYRLNYPNLNCIWVGPRNKQIYYPLELCEVAYGQSMNKQLNEFQLSNMVKLAATPPDERKRKIEECAQSMNYAGNELFKRFGLEISNKFFEVDAKVLNPPNLDCGEPNSAFPRKGAWNSQKLQSPSPLTSWGFIGLELPPQACNSESIIQLLTQTGSQMGMQVSSPAVVKFNVKMTELRSLFFTAAEKNIRFLFMILPTRGKDYYHKMKRMAECDVGILTQGIKEQTAQRRMNYQTAKNILLKVNSKLMGINQVLDNRSMPRCLQGGGVMIVGADVTHPSPDQQNIPSIAAVTASIDPKCYVYNIEMSIQAPKHEAIVQFNDMMVDHLKVYMEKNNNRLPKKIYIFRDGVSEGQFAEIMNKELKATYDAYARFSKEKPEILFMVVQKRHHTRLFGCDRRSGGIVNVEPGTVVDTHIVHPKELDFYLVSHQAIKGTARPTKYHSVRNDGNIPHDEVEQLTFFLCHLYSRCMRSVSYPTPTYYAHLACFRARSLTFGTVFDNEELYRNPKRLRVCEKMLKSSRMFFV